MDVVFENETCKVLLYRGSIENLGPFDQPSVNSKQNIARKYKYIRFSESGNLLSIDDVLVHNNCDPDLKEGLECLLYIYANKSDDPIHTVLAVTSPSRVSNDLPNFRHSQTLIGEYVYAMAGQHKIKGIGQIVRGALMILTFFLSIFGIPTLVAGFVSIKHSMKLKSAFQARMQGIPTPESFAKIIEIN